MNCQDLSDKMPAVLTGARSWSEAEAQHLAACADCRAEWTVVSSGATVASGATVNAEALAERVLLRLRTEPVVKPFHARKWLTGVAAVAAAILVIARVMTTAPLPPGPAAPLTAELAVDIPGLHALGEDGLAEVLESMAPLWTDTPTIDTPSLDDLDPRELEQLQRLWES